MSQYTRIDFQIEDELLRRLDHWRRMQADCPSRSEALNRLADEALKLRDALSELQTLC